jgi:cytochrome c biogenesis protein CcmG/thiol:disulfide interchange protein DsbE
MKLRRLAMPLSLTALMLLSLSAAHAQMSQPPPLPAGTKAPAIKTKTVNGKPFALQSLRGKVVLIDYWATWCGPCRMATPTLEALYKKYGHKGFVVVGMNLDDARTASQIKPFTKYFHMTYPIMVNPQANGRAQMAYNAQGIPAQYLIDKKGIVRWSQEGYSPDEATELPKKIKKLLAE